MIAVVKFLRSRRRADATALEENYATPRDTERERGSDAGRAGTDDAHLRGLRPRKRITHARSTADVDGKRPSTSAGSKRRDAII
ncbi:MAG TPA: hypothetical protein VFO67_03350 [Gemmatimonadales bacterium]|nr:hypothetical protein [Gemmatimonadales bacterium]